MAIATSATLARLSDFALAATLANSFRRSFGLGRLASTQRSNHGQRLGNDRRDQAKTDDCVNEARVNHEGVPKKTRVTGIATVSEIRPLSSRGMCGLGNF